VCVAVTFRYKSSEETVCVAVTYRYKSRDNVCGGDIHVKEQ